MEGQNEPDLGQLPLKSTSDVVNIAGVIADRSEGSVKYLV